MLVRISQLGPHLGLGDAGQDLGQKVARIVYKPRVGLTQRVQAQSVVTLAICAAVDLCRSCERCCPPPLPRLDSVLLNCSHRC